MMYKMLSTNHLHLLSNRFSAIRYQTVLALLCCLAPSQRARAQAVFSPQAAVEAAMKNHPLRKAADLDVNAKKYREKSALNLPNPELNAESPTGEFYTIGASQSFDFPTVYKRQKQVAQAETDWAKAAQILTENDMRYTVRALYLDAQVTDFQLIYWEKRDSLYQQINAAAARQFAAGEIDFLQKTLAENEAGIVPAEPESVADRHVDFSFLSHIERQIQSWVDVFIVRKVVDGRRDDAVFHGHDGGNRFYSTRSTKQMAGHGFG